jgi:hypothetical protein
MGHLDIPVRSITDLTTGSPSGFDKCGSVDEVSVFAIYYQPEVPTDRGEFRPVRPSFAHGRRGRGFFGGADLGRGRVGFGALAGSAGAVSAPSLASPLSKKRRIISERDSPLPLAWASRRAVSSFGSRMVSVGSRPVAGRPRPLFLGVTIIDFAIYRCYQNNRPARCFQHSAGLTHGGPAKRFQHFAGPDHPNPLM